MTIDIWVELRMEEMKQDFIKKNPEADAEKAIFIPTEFMDPDFKERLENAPETLFRNPETYQNYLASIGKGGSNEH